MNLIVFIVEKKKCFLYSIRMDIKQYLMKTSPFDEMNVIMNGNALFGMISNEQSSLSLIDILSCVHTIILHHQFIILCDEVKCLNNELFVCFYFWWIYFPMRQSDLWKNDWNSFRNRFDFEDDHLLFSFDNWLINGLFFL